MKVVVNSECDTIPRDSEPLVSQGSLVLNLLCALGYDPLNPPLAQVLKKQHNLEGNWAIVTPIYWQASHNDVVVVAAGDELELTDEESKIYFNLLERHLFSDGMTLFYHSADLWLVRIDNKPVPNAKPVADILNKSLMPELEALDDSLYWQKFNTEVQMLFATMPANKIALNGVWVWGAAACDKTAEVLCADQESMRLAQSVCNNPISYSPEIDIKKCQVLLLNSVSSLSGTQSLELKKEAESWYWNNCAYTKKDTNWLTRLWRTLIHAH